MTYTFKFVAISQNQKTGNIPQTYTDSRSCPKKCPFKATGCYAECGRTALHWRKTEIDLNQLKVAVKKATEKGQLLRHNIGGDIAKIGTSSIDEKLVSGLCEAFSGTKAYTYTHCTINEKSAKTINEAKEKGFIINASCEKLADVLKAKSLGVNTVLTVNTLTDDLKAKAKEKGINLVKCLNDKGLTCKKCQVCAKDRQSTIVFESHGSGIKKINAIIEKIKDY